MRYLTRNQLLTVSGAAVASVGSGFLHGRGAVLPFAISAVALATLASVVGLATEQLGERFGPGATGVLQSAIGNLPELFVGIFALRAGLVAVVQAAVIGSILANSLLVLGLAILVGGLKHGTQRFSSEQPKVIATLLLLAIAALTLPTLVHELHTPAEAHADALSIACAVVLLIVFILSVPYSLKSELPKEMENANPGVRPPHASWPLPMTIGVLVAAGVGAAFVSDWFVDALEPAMAMLHLSQAFTGLVVVAIAGNAVENVVGIQLAARNKPDYAVSVILNSSLQVALALIPVLVILSFLFSPHHLTLIMPPLLVVALGFAAALGAVIVYDGESVWLEGVALIGLYGIIAASFWWG
ncbi:MAG: calcium/proton exchanger [Thermoanaerobaculia bacterium]|jgi:Ca2+:H+ antiporter